MYNKIYWLAFLFLISGVIAVSFIQSVSKSSYICDTKRANVHYGNKGLL